MVKINIERLRPATVIHRTGNDAFGPFGACAEVQDIRFDGEAYQITARMLEGHDDHVSDTEVEFTVWAGESIAYGGRGAPKLRDEADISDDEWQAKRNANPITLDAATEAFCAMLVGRNPRREQFFAAVMQAAE